MNIFRFYSEYRTNKKKEKLLFSEFYKDLEKFNSMASKKQWARKEYLYPCLFDKTSSTEIEPIYFLQDSWAFERIYHNKPIKHIDVGSHHKFVAFLSKIVDTTMVDIRPLSVDMPSIKFLKGSILQLPFTDNEIDSLSSLCVIEHIGLGRYGDALDPQGSEKALEEITRVLKPGGHLYLSVPISDKYIVAFNAGRIFSLDYLIKLLNQYKITDQKFINGSCLQNMFAPNNSFGCTILLDLIKK